MGLTGVRETEGEHTGAVLDAGDLAVHTVQATRVRRVGARQRTPRARGDVGGDGRRPDGRALLDDDDPVYCSEVVADVTFEAPSARSFGSEAATGSTRDATTTAAAAPAAAAERRST